MVCCLLATACHGPEFDRYLVTKAKIYTTGGASMTPGQVQDFYAVLEPGDAEDIHLYSFSVGTYLTIQLQNEVTVEQARAAIGSQVTIPDNAKCHFCRVRSQTPPRTMQSTVTIKSSFHRSISGIFTLTLYRN